jgi:competence protein ComEC
MTRRRAFIYFLILCLVLIFSVLLFYKSLTLYFAGQEKRLEVTFLDVGQGDATLIETPFGQNILIDAGPDETVIKRLSEELPWWDRKIDLFILTHPHADHLAGAVDVLRRYDLGQVLMTRAPCSETVCDTFVKALARVGAGTTWLDSEQNIQLGEACDLRIIFPSRQDQLASIEDLNETSIVSRLDCAHTSFIFMGDAGKESEAKLLARNVNLRAEVLKVGHHGSDTSSGAEFLKAVNMDYAVISVGQDNRYGHPSESVLSDLSATKARILRSDQSGSLRFIKETKGPLYLK